MKDKKVIFMGTPEFAVPVLEMLIEKTNVVLVVTQPDKLVGRHQTLESTPIKKIALKNSIEVFTPTNIKEENSIIFEKDADIIITCAFGQFIPERILEYPKHKSINVHASLLPKLRGGAPIHKSIIDGYKETGVTIMYMSKKMDAGDIISSEKIEIGINDNVGIIHDKLSLLAPNLLLKTLDSIFNNTNERIKQNEEEVTYAYNITREEEKVDFNKNSIEVHNLVRGLYPFPTSYAYLFDKIIKICETELNDSTEGSIGEITSVTKNGIIVKCKDKSVLIKKVKPSGKKEMSALDFVNGIGKDNIIGSKFE